MTSFRSEYECADKRIKIYVGHFDTQVFHYQVIVFHVHSYEFYLLVFQQRLYYFDSPVYFDSFFLLLPFLFLFSKHRFTYIVLMLSVQADVISFVFFYRKSNPDQVAYHWIYVVCFRIEYNHWFFGKFLYQFF